MCGKYVLQIGDDAWLDTTLVAHLYRSHLPPRSPRLLLLEPGIFRRSGIIECVIECLCVVLNGAVLRMGSVVETATDVLDVKKCSMRATSENSRHGRTHTARASSLSSIPECFGGCVAADDTVPQDMI